MRRRFFDRAFVAVTGACAVLCCATLLGLVGAIALRGLPALRFDFLVGTMREAGAAGGIGYHLAGTVLLMATALAVTVPLALGLALLQGVYLRGHRRARRLVTAALQVLNSVPSILFGIVGLVVFVKYLGWGKSWLAGGILLGLMILPTVAVSLVERIEAIPRSYVDAAAGLGLSQSQVIASVILPQCMTGLVTGCLLGLARAAGETAPIMFTATVFAGVELPQGVRESPVLTLPYHIFVLAQDSFDPRAGGQMWGAALVLVALSFGLSLLALPLRAWIHEEAGRG